LSLGGYFMVTGSRVSHSETCAQPPHRFDFNFLGGDDGRWLGPSMRKPVDVKN
jgi:hypothetical protein